MGVVASRLSTMYIPSEVIGEYVYVADYNPDHQEQVTVNKASKSKNPETFQRVNSSNQLKRGNSYNQLQRGRSSNQLQRVNSSNQLQRCISSNQLQRVNSSNQLQR